MNKRVDGLVSIIMPAYNAERYISSAIDSVLSQSYNKFELIIVDDCSIDKTRSIIKTYECHQNIKSVYLSHNVGVAEARNIAISHSSGQYLSFLDSDDIWLPEKLSEQILLLKKVGGFCSHASYIRFSDLGGFNNTVKAKAKVCFSDMLKGNEIGNLTGLYDVNQLGIFKQKKVGHEDYLMWLSIVNKAVSFGVEKPLAMYRVRSGSISSNKIKAIKWQYNIIRNEMGQGIFISVYYCLFYFIKATLKRCRFL